VDRRPSSPVVSPSPTMEAVSSARHSKPYQSQQQPLSVGSCLDQLVLSRLRLLRLLVRLDAQRTLIQARLRRLAQQRKLLPVVSIYQEV